MDMLCIIQFNTGKLMTSRLNLDNGTSNDRRRECMREGLMSVVCELTMEYGHHAMLTDDHTTASFVFDVLVSDDIECELTFMKAEHYTAEVTMSLTKAGRPLREEHVGQYIYVPISIMLKEDGTDEPYIEDVYYANVRVTNALRDGLLQLGREYVYNARIPPVGACRKRYVRLANAYEAIGMDAD